MFRFRYFSATTVGVVVFGLVAVVCIALVAAGDSEEETGADDISHGLGHHIAWQTLEKGLNLSKTEDKPLMIIIHKSWCGACRSLIPKLKESEDLALLSTSFIMVNTQDNDEPTEDIYKPDGGYIPRILFFDSQGLLLKDIINEGGNDQYKYYYYDAESVLNSMRKVDSMFPDISEVDYEDEDEIQTLRAKNEL